MAKKDYYEILGIDKSATEAELKSAFRKKAKAFHPDVNKDKGAEAKFKEIGEAYSVLSDPSKRAKYDQYGSAAFENGGQGGYGGGGFSGGFGSFDFDDLDLGSIFEQFMGGSGFNSSRGRSSKRAAKGEDYLVKINLTFEEAIKGTQKSFTLAINEICADCKGEGGHDKETCKHCGGRGRIIQEQRTILGVMQTETTCPYCNGSGYTFKNVCNTCKGKQTVKKNKTIKLRVPKGIDSGDQMRMTGKGSAGLNGGPAGDVYINFTVKDHPLFKRDGKDVYLIVPLSITEAALGVTKKIPTVYDTVKHTFSAGTQNNEKIRLRGKGIENDKTNSTGDLFIITNIIVPAKLDRKQKAILKDLNESNLKTDPAFKSFDKFI